MKVKCPECKKDVIIVKNYTHILCESCKLDWEFKEFIMVLMRSDKTAMDVLADYEKKLQETSESYVSWG
ncbi:MAG: hypothetical protein NPMRTH1_820050 [Nitrosopumilales archaeon]|nr:MAG: hypothetical protein NPMRTH1_820050 [Nitrosopumilales archaeon]